MYSIFEMLKKGNFGRKKKILLKEGFESLVLVTHTGP